MLCTPHDHIYPVISSGSTAREMGVMLEHLRSVHQVEPPDMRKWESDPERGEYMHMDLDRRKGEWQTIKISVWVLPEPDFRAAIQRVFSEGETREREEERNAKPE